MKLWLLKNIEGASWDELDAIVIRAETEERAREIAQHNGHDETGKHIRGGPWPFWTKPTKASCVELMADGPEEVIIADVLEG